MSDTLKGSDAAGDFVVKASVSNDACVSPAKHMTHMSVKTEILCNTNHFCFTVYWVEDDTTGKDRCGSSVAHPLWSARGRNVLKNGHAGIPPRLARSGQQRNSITHYSSRVSSSAKSSEKISLFSFHQDLTPGCSKYRLIDRRLDSHMFLSRRPSRVCT